MFRSIRNLIYYLWNGETKEEHARRQEEIDRLNRELIAKREAREAAERVAEEEHRAKEAAYRRFVASHGVTRCDAIDLDDNAIREQRRAAMRSAKEIQDSMSD